MTSGKLFYSLVALLFLAGCNLQKEWTALRLDAVGGGVVDIEIPASAADQITFKLVQSKVIEKHCAGCHSEKGGNKGHVNLETYENVYENRADILADIKSGRMPPKKHPELKLSDAQVKFIADWIESGAREDVGTTPPAVAEPPPVANPPVAGEVVFKDVLERVLVTSCNKCHSEAGQNDGDLNLETYENVFAAREKIREDVVGGFMPPRREPRLTEEQKKLIIDWIEGGAKEVGVSTPPVIETPKVVEVPVSAFNLVMEKVVKKNCVGCHSEPKNKGGVNLESYEKIFESRFEIKAAIEDGSMPTSRGTPLNDDQKKLILDWLNMGALRL